MLERQREGIVIAKEKGKYRGRISQFNSDDIKEIQSRFAETSNKAELAREYGISRGYLYELVKT